MLSPRKPLKHNKKSTRGGGGRPSAGRARGDGSPQSKKIPQAIEDRLHSLETQLREVIMDQEDENIRFRCRLDGGDGVAKQHADRLQSAADRLFRLEQGLQKALDWTPVLSRLEALEWHRQDLVSRMVKLESNQPRFVGPVPPVVPRDYYCPPVQHDMPPVNVPNNFPNITWPTGPTCGSLGDCIDARKVR